MTNYIVLRRGSAAGDPGAWEIMGHAEASGPEAARKKVVDQAGEYLVVPRRNATFLAVTVEQPPPRARSVEVDWSEYAPQLTLDEAVEPVSL